MLDIKNANPQQTKAYMKSKRVYVYGAGRALESCIDIYLQETSVEGIVDSDPDKAGTVIDIENQHVKVIDKKQFVQFYHNCTEKEEIVLFISSSVYAADIVSELDQIEELDGLQCFLQVLVRNTFGEHRDFEFSDGQEIIPRKIHYIWIGGNSLPYEFQKNIESWKYYNPSYEIIRWDESNYDFRKNDYMRLAYDKGLYGFSSNYARLDILNQYGGIYLDTDVEAVSNLDMLLRDKTFFNMGCADRVNMGCGFGTVSHQKIIQDILNQFGNCSENMTKRPFHNFIHPILKKYGFEIINFYQKINRIVLYPSDIMSPLTIEGMANNFSKNTVSIHRESGTWMSKEEKQKAKDLNKIVQRASNI